VLQCVAVRYSVLQWVLQCVAACCREDNVSISIYFCGDVNIHLRECILYFVAVCCSVLKCVAVCCSVLQRLQYTSERVHSSIVLQCIAQYCVAGRCNMLLCVAACCSDVNIHLRECIVLQCVATQCV